MKRPTSNKSNIQYSMKSSCIVFKQIGVKGSLGQGTTFTMSKLEQKEKSREVATLKNGRVQSENICLKT